MILLFLILFLFSFGLIYFVNKLYSNGYLDKKQYRFYILILIIFVLFLVGQMDKTNL
jgi:hypothetical protein